MNDVSDESNFGLTNKNMTTGAVIQMHLSAEDEVVELTSLVNSTTGTSGMDDNDCNRVISSLIYQFMFYPCFCSLTNKNMTTGAVIQMHLSAEDEAVELTSLVNSTTGTSGMDDNDCNRVISWEQDEYKESNSMKSDGQDLDKISKNDISTAVVKFDRLIVDTINPTTLHLDWAPCSQCLSVSGYKIRYNIRDNACYNEIFVTHGITSYTISGLKPNTEYDVCVNAMDQHQKVICSCGNVTQRTDPMMKDKKRYDVPYMAVITAACLLIIAALVPLTFLLLRECVKCDMSLNTSPDKDPSYPLKQPNLVSYGQPIYENSN